MPSTSAELQLGLLLNGRPLRVTGGLKGAGYLVFAGSLDVDRDFLLFLASQWPDKSDVGSPLEPDQLGATAAVLDVFYIKAPTKDGSSGYFYGLSFRSHLGLEAAPLFGGLLSRIVLKQFQFIYASDKISAPNLSLPGPAASGGQPADDLNFMLPLLPGLSLALTIDSGDALQTFAFPIWQPEPAKELALAAGNGGGFSKWFDVQKSLGPLSIQRVGVEWKTGKVGLMLDAGVRLSILSIAFKGFALRFPPSLLLHFSLDALKKELDIGLDGLDVSYQSERV